MEEGEYVATEPSTLAVTTEPSPDRMIAVTGLLFAFMSTLMMFSTFMASRGRR